MNRLTAVILKHSGDRGVMLTRMYTHNSIFIQLHYFHLDIQLNSDFVISVLHYLFSHYIMTINIMCYGYSESESIVTKDQKTRIHSKRCY